MRFGNAAAVQLMAASGAHSRRARAMPADEWHCKVCSRRSRSLHIRVLLVSRCAAAEHCGLSRVYVRSLRGGRKRNAGMSAAVPGCIEAATSRAHDTTGAAAPASASKATRAQQPHCFCCCRLRPNDPIADGGSPGPNTTPTRYGWYAPGPASSLLAPPEGSYVPSTYVSASHR